MLETIPVPSCASRSKSFIVTFATFANLGCFFSSGLTCVFGDGESRARFFSPTRRDGGPDASDAMPTIDTPMRLPCGMTLPNRLCKAAKGDVLAKLKAGNPRMEQGKVFLSIRAFKLLQAAYMSSAYKK